MGKLNAARTESGGWLDLLSEGRYRETFPVVQMSFKLEGDCGGATHTTVSLVNPAAVQCEKGMPVL